MQDSLKDCELVCSINVDGVNKHYNSYKMRDLLKKRKEWEKIDVLFQIPAIESNNYEFALYFWNRSQDKLYYDDFAFKIYK